ncbi:uncharacterized protein LOC129761559 [Toxorhynchites rutilus septentrionalis]|uniref:uncharacterized protein LOC129761559 n=1 Tax=Toxorhynchites rutilus septentrionalis TaxID=329112 RepID=UPI00247AD720|nr:uncharacterized protein LOC129761559 [Toxorhynchites rutilus septentrionalis]
MPPVAKRDDISKVVRTSHEVRNQGSSTVHQIVDTDTEYVFNVTTTDNDGEVQCEIGGVTISAVIDSGSKYNLLSEIIWQQMKSKKVVVNNQTREVSKIFKVYGGQELVVLSAFTATIKVGERITSAKFYVVKGNGKILIGRDTATVMGILKIDAAVNEINAEDKASPLGTIKDVVIDIPIMTDVVPVIQPYRRIPVALEKLVDKKLDELLNKGVI